MLCGSENKQRLFPYTKNHIEAIFCPMIPTSHTACLPLTVHRLRSFVILVIEECGALMDGYWQSKAELVSEICPNSTSSTKNLTLTDPGSNRGHRLQRSATDRLSHDNAFPCRALSAVFNNKDALFTARYELNLRVMYINPSKPSGHYMSRYFFIQVAPQLTSRGYKTW